MKKHLQYIILGIAQVDKFLVTYRVRSCTTFPLDFTPDGVQLLGRSVSIGCCDVVGIVFAFSFELCRIHLVLFYSYVILECTRYH
jgi:hypothetical protein